MRKYHRLLGISGIFASLFFLPNTLTAQVNTIGQTNGRVITSAVPFLGISPDARASGMGDMGAALSADVNSIHWNPGKLAFVEDDIGVGISYTPWLAALDLTDDMSISYLSGFYKISKEQTVGISMRYFDLGSFQQTFIDGSEGALFSPREFAFAASYSRKLSQDFAIGVAFRYAHSQLLGNLGGSTSPADAARTVAGDIGIYYNKSLVIGGRPSTITVGSAISNIGPKVTYTNDSRRDFIPTNLRIGTAFTSEMDVYNKFTVGVEFNKLMVPTPPFNDEGVLVGTPLADQTLLQGMFGSFADAPNGFSEELKEITISVGAEYWYNNTFAARAGYFHEAAEKGNRKYITLGLGFRYNVFGIDFAYLTAPEQRHPLDDTLRFSLLFKFDDGKEEDSVIDN